MKRMVFAYGLFLLNIVIAVLSIDRAPWHGSVNFFAAGFIAMYLVGEEMK